jgi:hypothetical protein
VYHHVIIFYIVICVVWGDTLYLFSMLVFGRMTLWRALHRHYASAAKTRAETTQIAQCLARIGQRLDRIRLASETTSHPMRWSDSDVSVSQLNEQYTQLKELSGKLTG